MKRKIIQPRVDWKTKVEQLGFSYHTLDGVTYWDESIYYSFVRNEADKIEQTTNELYQLCLQAVDHVVRNGLYELFLIPDKFKNKIEESWRNSEPSVYGRFDLVWDGNSNSSP